MHRVRPVFVRLVVAAALIAAAWVPAIGSPVAATPSTTLTRYPYLTDSVQSSITINWATDQSATTGSVRWGPTGNCSANTTTATKTSMTVVDKPEYQWKATIPVSPDTKYCYRVRLGSLDLLGSDATPQFTSQVRAGSTAPFSFAVFGDWGRAFANSANVNQENVLRQISLSGVRFAVMTGDTAYQSGRQSSYGDLQQKGSDVSGVFAPNFWTVPGKSIPVFNVPGNHGYDHGDVMLLNWPEQNATSTSGGKYQLESYPSINGSDPDTYPSIWYAFDAGPARFYALTAAWDSNNTGNGDQYEADALAHWAPSKSEYQWLKNDLAAHPDALKFAFFHYPLYSDTHGQGSDTFLQGGSGTLQGLLNQYDVKIAFNGHAHAYERNRPDSGGLLTYVNGNGGAELGDVGGCEAFDLYAIGEDGSRCGSAPAGLTDEQVYGFSKVTVNGRKVTVTPTDSLGHTYDVQTYDFTGPK